MEKTHIKTIIIGGGPAGVTCGYQLVKHHEDCLIIDRKEFPREKLCGGGLTPKAHILIDKIFTGIKYDYCSVNKIDMYSNSKYVCSFSLNTELRTVARKDFDHILLEQYKAIGGQVITDTLSKIEEKDNKIFLTLLSGRIFTCDNLIGADGTNSLVRKYLQPNFKKGTLCLEKNVSDMSIRDMRVYFDKKFKDGYFYLFPNLNGYAVGYGDALTTTERFHQSLEEYNLTDESKTKGAYIPMFDKIEYSFHKNILLIGDAGGYADSMTGEGIYFAVKSGQNAASSIIENKDFETSNKGVIDIIRKRKKMAHLFYFPPVMKLFVYMCKKPSLLRRINNKVNEAMISPAD